MVNRRILLESGGPLLAGLIFPGHVSASSVTHTIEMDSDADGAKVWFNPIGLFVMPGDKVRWVIKNSVHTVSAYHPDNDGHSLRIPEKADSWHSGYLVEPGEHFEVTLSVPGVYDYYCEPHEEAGMVGRIVVGEISGPGAMPFDYFRKSDPAPDWLEVPEGASAMFPDPRKIVTQKIVRVEGV